MAATIKRFLPCWSDSGNGLCGTEDSDENLKSGRLKYEV